MNVQTAAFTCRRCGRPLRNPESIQRGIGPVCAQRSLVDAMSKFQENGVIITANGQPLEHIIHHSPTGMEWGYGGSGPADLALSILAHYLGEQMAVQRYLNAMNQPAGTWDLTEPAAVRLYQRFKWAFVANFDREAWRLTGTQIAAWLWAQGITESPLREVVYEGRRAL